MKVFVTLSALFAVTMARGYSAQDSYSQQHHTPSYHQQPQQPQHYQAPKHEQYSAQKPPIPILKYDSKLNHDGSYQYAYETGNGIQAAEQGYVKNAGQKDNEIQVAEGYFQYTGDDGIPISLKYVADENGFQPQGDHLPTPVPLPKEIIEAYEKIAADPRQNDGDDGQYRAEQHQQHKYHPSQHQQQYDQSQHYKY
ncbi:Endocuticle structural glycoprotein SgAbd-2 [Pseudolycoriella hygida]|uniref:Endocuticle structural glycoprotein SgAbd-2 n=1 Tax=Pseudolycoriella hygida TaxID=35572 RepID=A0A9Q0MKZ5_9DIPT|nr:Endocuticle structural glycoprotein SgAbd-2 [Pseudolycoriella hygida]